jgi:hypothetical protein
MPGRHVVTAPDEAELAAAVHENLYALFRSMQLLPGGELEESTSLSLHHAFPPNPMFRGRGGAACRRKRSNEALTAWSSGSAGAGRRLFSGGPTGRHGFKGLDGRRQLYRLAVDGSALPGDAA